MLSLIRIGINVGFMILSLFFIFEKNDIAYVNTVQRYLNLVLWWLKIEVKK